MRNDRIVLLVSAPDGMASKPGHAGIPKRGSELFGPGFPVTAFLDAVDIQPQLSRRGPPILDIRCLGGAVL
jgi:hypothetical protein